VDSVLAVDRPFFRPSQVERMQVRLALALQVASGDGSVRQAFHPKRIFVFSLNSNLQLGPVDQVREDRQPFLLDLVCAGGEAGGRIS